MSEVVIDTNVLLVANRAHEGASPGCVQACVEYLLHAQQACVIVLDDRYRILNEYQNKTNANRGKGVGDAFLKWLLQNKSNRTRIHQVRLTEAPNGCFAEFPDPALEPKFDASDRKFAAIANAHPNKPPIWQAADCKWLAWWQPLAAKGVQVIFLCPNDVCEVYKRKFPGLPLPPLPPLPP